MKTFTGPDDGLDNHDFIKMPDGNFLGLEYLHRDCLSTPSECVDLSSGGDSDQSAIIDAKIIEFAPDGTVLWSWRAADHIDVAIENANWHYGNHDIVHMNSLEYDGNGGIIFSARHLDAVYRIDMTSGDVTWKLGGTTTPESLTVVGPKGLSTFSGQHFARLLPDGTLTVHDNWTKKGKSPRAIRFSIDPGAKTATVVSWISDPRVPDSICCGNAYLLPTGNWVAAWGASNAVTELMPSAQPTITIDFQTMFTYRVAPVLATIRSLRQAMNIAYAVNP